MTFIHFLSTDCLFFLSALEGLAGSNLRGSSAVYNFCCFFSIKMSMKRRLPFGAVGIVEAISISSRCSCFSFSSSSSCFFSSFSFSSSAVLPSSFFLILEMMPNAKAFFAACFLGRCYGTAFVSCFLRVSYPPTIVCLLCIVEPMLDCRDIPRLLLESVRPPALMMAPPGFDPENLLVCYLASPLLTGRVFPRVWETDRLD